MKRKRTLQLLVLSMVICSSIAGVALAASSPTVRTGGATKVTGTSAVLNGTINPNGNRTLYGFVYGPTTAYGAATTVRSIRAGTKSVAVARTITGLTPGTTYHFRVNGENGAGSSSGADRTFTTTGHPPAAVVTGAPINVGKTTATATGVINPNDEATTWVVQYGLTTAYGTESFSQMLPAVNQAIGVSVPLSGLAPGTLFHYRVVAFHGSQFVSAGADATFFTEPSTRAKPRFTAHTSPSRDTRSPYTFTTKGTLSGAGSIPAAQRCAGNVGIRYYNGRRQLAFVVAPIAPNCKFSAPASFRRLHGTGPLTLKITVDYRGTGYVAPVNKVDHVSAG